MNQLLLLKDYLAHAQNEHVISATITNGELVIIVNLAQIVLLMEFLKQDSKCQFTTLIDITAIDYPGRADRFDVVYHLLSMPLNFRLRLKATIEDGEAVPSISSVFPCANWFEREVFDMYGIVFSGHPDLRRLLTDYGFSGHPLRKDFPLTGYSEVKYDEVQKKVVYEPVELVQEFRNFDFISPWEGIGDIPQDKSNSNQDQ
ncbi:MAG: NADH-quinone oxidoreductase subunit C [Rhodobacteraceae bacterium]|nr:NADH-quinone oxidoreductase subunit C [Paracoccaceae bacterium]